MGPCSIKSVKLQAANLPLEEPCPKFCTRELNPVCAKSGGELREFANKCVLQTINCETERSKFYREYTDAK